MDMFFTARGPQNEELQNTEIKKEKTIWELINNNQKFQKEYTETKRVGTKTAKGPKGGKEDEQQSVAQLQADWEEKPEDQ